MSQFTPAAAQAGHQRLARALLASLSIMTALPAAATSYSFTTSGTSWDVTRAAVDVNRSGTVVGYTLDNLTGVSSAFQYANGVVSDVAGPAGAVSVDLAGITDSGVVVGNFSTTLEDDGFGNIFPGPTRMFSLANGVYTEVSIPGLDAPYLGGVSANGRWLLGAAVDGQGQYRGFAYDTLDSTLTSFSGNATNVIASGINDLGVVVGYDRTSVPGVGQTGPGWTVDLNTGARTEFQVAGSLRSGPRDITDTGVMSGYYYTSLQPAVAHGFTGLNGNFAFFDVPGASQTFVLGANDLGALVGQYVDADGNAGAFLAVPVPEPATAAMLLLGLAGLTGVASRRARHAGSAGAAG